MRFYYLFAFVFLFSCEKTEFNPPVLEPELDSNFVFNSGEEIELQAGVDGYYLHTNSFISNNKKVYQSTLSNNIGCQESCSPELTIEIHQGDTNGSLADLALDNLNFLDHKDQSVNHQFNVINSSTAFNHLWKVGDGLPNDDDNLLLNQDFGQGSTSNVNLLFRSEQKAIVKFEQVFSPIGQEAVNVALNISKFQDSVYVKFDTTDVSEVLLQNINGFNFEFEGPVSQSFIITTKAGAIINGLIIVPEAHPSFELSEMGYSYSNELTPFIDPIQLESLEIIYKDEDGMIFRSSAIDQIIPTVYELVSMEEYLDNESGLPTIRCEMNISCLIYSNQIKQAKYITDGKFRFAFLKD